MRRRLRDPGSLEVLAGLEESIALAADRLRRLMFDLRPPALERAGLAAAVRDSLSRLRDDAGVEVRLQWFGVELLSRRIIEERAASLPVLDRKPPPRRIDAVEGVRDVLAVHARNAIPGGASPAAVLLDPG